MKMVVGLGNPGNIYSRSRHNIGFSVIDEIIKDENLSFKKDNNFEYVKDPRNNIIYLKPLSFMNLSGEVVKKVAHFYKVGLENILVVHDDKDQKIGKYKIKKNSGSGGHNGVKSIIENLSTDTFLRLKIGIAVEEMPPTSEFVLGNFSAEEVKVINEKMNLFKDIIKDFASLNAEELMNKYNDRGSIW